MPHLLRIPESQRHRDTTVPHNTKGYQLFPERTRELTKSVRHTFILRL